MLGELGQVRSIKEIGGAISRVVYSESVYICHFGEEGAEVVQTMLALKRVSEAKINSETAEIETFDDKFEVLPLGMFVGI